MKQGYAGTDFIRVTVKRAFHIRFFLSFFLICLAFFLDTEVSMRQIMLGKYPPTGTEGIVLYLEYVLLYGTNYKLFLIFMTLGYGTSFPADYKCGMVHGFVSRMGIKTYARIQIGISALSGGLAVAGGFLLYFFWMRMFIPVIPEHFRETGMYDWLEAMPYYGDLTQENARLFVVYMLLILFLSGVTWTALAAGFSVYLNHTYLVMIFPYFLSRMYIEAAKMLRLPDEIRIDRWFTGLTQPFPIPVCLGLLLVFCVFICIIGRRIFSKALKWRLENG